MFFVLKTLTFLFVLTIGTVCARSEEAERSHTEAPSESAETFRLAPKESETFMKAANAGKAPWYSVKESSVRYLPEHIDKKPAGIKNDISRNVETNINAVLNAIYWTVVTIVGIGLLGLIVWFIYKNQSTIGKKKTEDPYERARRIETLASEAAERYDDLLNAAIDALAGNDVRMALIYYFSWLLVEMDKREFVFLNKGKTNLEYWRELEGYDELRSIYRRVMKEFETVYYGGEPVSRGEFERVWELRTPFEKIMIEKDAQTNGAANVAETASGVSTSLGAITLFFALSLTPLGIGCSNSQKPEWDGRYSDSIVYDSAKNMNATTSYVNYLRSFRKDKVSIYKNAQAPDREDLDCVVWFNGLFDSTGMALINPLPGGDGDFYAGNLRILGSPARKISANRETDETEEDEYKTLSPEARAAAWEKCVRSYAESSPKDLTRFAIEGHGEAFTRRQQEIVQWLRKRPGRTFVFVASAQDWRAQYLFDCIQKFESQGIDESDVSYGQCAHLFDGEARDSLERNRFTALQKEFEKRRKTARRLIDASEKEREVFRLLGRLPSARPNYSVIGGPSDPSGDSERALDDSGSKTITDATKGESSSDEELKLSVFMHNSFYPFTAEDYQTNGVNTGEFLTDEARETFERLDAEEALLFTTRFVDASIDADEDDPIADVWARYHPLERVGGDPGWTSRLPKSLPRAANIRFEPHGETSALLTLGDNPIVCERKIGESRLLLVNSSSYFSNYGLLDPSNQAVASRVSAEIPKRSRVAVVLGNFNGFVEQELIAGEAGPFSLTRFTPYTLFIWHVFVLTLLVAFCAYPIFGRAKRIRRELTNDYGRHIEAVAQKLERIGAVDWTQKQIDAFRDADKFPEL